MELEGVNGHEQEQHETCDGQIQLTAGRRNSLAPEERQIDQPILLSICEADLEEVSKHELEQQTRRQLLIPTPEERKREQPRLLRTCEGKIARGVQS